MRKIFLRNILKNKTVLVVAFCAFLLITTFANILRNNYIKQNLPINNLPPPPPPPPPQEPVPNQPQVQIIHHTLARVTTLPPPQLQPPKIDPRNYLQKNPSLLSCSKEYSKWQSSEATVAAAPPPPSFDYAKPSPTSTHSLRILRAVLVYFPIESLEHFKLEFKWLYRSWIEMQKFEPKMWRTDLIVFIENDKKIFADENLFFNKLKCEFTNLRMSDTDAPMCTLIDFKPLQKRENVGSGPAAIKKSYEAILDETKIFEDDSLDLAPFYSLMKTNLIKYGYLNSILMAFEGYKYFKTAKYDFLIRSDMDVFLTPLFAEWIPRHCNDFCVGGGAFSNDFNDKRFKRIAKGLGLAYAGARNLGSTWYSTPAQFRLVSFMTLFGMAYLSAEEFSQPEREGKVGTLLWPEWHYGVLLLYGQSLGMNHLIGTKQLNVIQLPHLIDYPSGNIEPIRSKLHIHVFHGDDMFSKFVFKMGRYDNMTVSNENATLVKYYALKMALEGKKLPESQLVADLKAIQKT